MKRLVSALLLIVASACSQKEETAPTRPIAEIKGKPIAAAPSTNTPPPLASSSNTQSTNLNPQPLASTNQLVAVNGFFPVDFARLASFHYVMPDEISATNQPPADQFPPAIKSLNDKPISLRGFMLPLKVEQGLVTEMLIMRDQSMCCYGTSPKINEWVSVKMNDKGVKPIMDQPVTLFGKLRVGEMRENGYLVGIYQLDGEKMESE
jgi:hypothetical protein